MALSCAALAVLSLAAAQAGGAQGNPQGGPLGNGKVPAQTEGGPPQEDMVTPPPSMNVRIPGTRASPADTTTAGLDLALSTQLLSQTLAATGSATQIQLGLQVSPTVAVGLLFPRFGLAVGYNPQLYLVTVSQGPLDVLHRGWLMMEYHAAATWRLYFAERLTYGTNNLSTPVLNNGGSAGQQPPTLNPVKLATVDYVYNETSLGVSSRLSRPLRFTFVAAYLNSGGLGTASQVVMPYQWGPRVEATLDWKASSTSTLASAFAAQANIFPVLYTTDASGNPVAGPGRQIYLTQVAETWRTALTRHTSAWLIGGLSVANTDSTTALSYKRLAPILGAGLESGTNSRQPLVIFLQLLLTPYVDPYLAVEYQRLTANANLTWKPAAPWSLGVAATAAYVPYRYQATVSELAVSKYGTAGPTIAFFPFRALTLSAGAYWQWQLASQTAAASFNQWGAYFTVTVADFEHI